MCVHAKGKDKKLADKRRKKNAQNVHEIGIKQINTIDMASTACGRRHDKQQDKQTNKKTNKARKQANKQKVVFARDKCRFGSDVHNFIVLKHG